MWCDARVALHGNAFVATREMSLRDLVASQRDLVLSQRDLAASQRDLVLSQRGLAAL